MVCSFSFLHTVKCSKWAAKHSRNLQVANHIPSMVLVAHNFLTFQEVMQSSLLEYASHLSVALYTRERSALWDFVTGFGGRGGGFLQIWKSCIIDHIHKHCSVLVLGNSISSPSTYLETTVILLHLSNETGMGTKGTSVCICTYSLLCKQLCSNSKWH